eukprot:5879223-Ditylum_brightwellii.AAC.1
MDGEVLKNHIFEASEDAPHMLNITEYAGCKAVQQDLKKTQITKKSTERQLALLNQKWLQEFNSYVLKTLTLPGLAEIKQVEMYAKWRKA